MEYSKRMAYLGAAMGALTLTACTAQLGGVGQLSDGSPVTGNLTADAMSGRNIIQIASPAGWTCESIMTENKAGSMNVTLPMTCSNGAKGTMILTMNEIQKQLFGSFHLDNGKTGQVSFGFKPA